MDKTLNVSIIYGVTTCLSLLLAGGYSTIVRKKENWLTWLYFSVFVANLGYFTLSISKTLEEALLANRLAYLGCVFLPLFMMMTIMKVCKVKCSKVVMGILFAISFIIFLIAASPGYLECYYKTVTIEFINGTTKLIKEYGPLHSLYFVYLFAYLLGMIGVIIYSVIIKKVKSVKHACLLVVVVCFNICIWFIEQLINWDFEFLSISYIASELLLLLLYDMIQDYENMKNIALPDTVQDAEEVQKDVVTTPMDWPGAEMLSAREKDVLIRMLEDKKRKEIADELCITENTVKKHVSSIFAKLEVTNRNELFAKVARK
jgi:DNA-binding CsgD family transcriptional regulator